MKQWTKHKWNANYLVSTSRVRAFIPRVSSRPLGMSLPRTSWVRFNRLRTGVGRFHSSMYKWGLAPSPNCECGATEQTADNIISSCLIHHVPRGTCRFWMTQLDVGLTPPVPASNLGSAVARGGKRIDLRPWPDLCWPGLSLGARPNDDDDDDNCTLAFEPDFLLEQRSTLSSGCPS